MFSLVQARAQNTEGLSGAVILPNGSGVPQAIVRLDGTLFRSQTNDSGKFYIEDIPIGTYSLTVNRIGFSPSSTIVTLKAGHPTEIFITVKEKAVVVSEVVVTGTRTEKELSDVPTPTTLVSQKDIKSQSAVRLDDVLGEQTGLATTSFLGTGVQVQGFDPAYTLILVDGQPVIGRNGGTLDLKRLNVGNLKQIEIVKGPSSALYGSEALAGVINLITETPSEPFGFSLRSRYATHNSIDVGTNLQTMQGDLGASLYVQRSSSDGFNHTPENPTLSAPSFVNYGINPKITYQISPALDLKISSRVSLETQKNKTVITSLPGLFTDNFTITDWSMNPSATYHFNPLVQLSVRGYYAEYGTESKIVSDMTHIQAERTTFDEHMMKGEFETNATIRASYIVTAGGGYSLEKVQADRVSGGVQEATTWYAYAQNEWIPTSIFDLIVSYRFDSPSNYAARFSPKISTLVKPTDWLSIRSSIGSGFKAPSFQQLYLDFTNAQVGYSVFGATSIKQSLAALDALGQIQNYIIDPSTIQIIKPEYSVAYNLGVEATIGEFALVKVGAYRNDVKDLIETLPVANKTNGQQVFSYFNLNTVYTQGIETEVKIFPVEHFAVTVGYQYLEAIDVNVLQQIRDHKIFKFGATGIARPVQEVEYGGLFNRSPHSGVVKITYDNTDAGTILSLRCTVRDKYGDQDLNGNGILDDASEYVPGYALYNFTLNQKVWEPLSAQFGIDNIFNKTNKKQIPSLPGRIVYGGLSLGF
jgi:outer membrane receptor for ferrienterochelin and colicins